MFTNKIHHCQYSPNDKELLIQYNIVLVILVGRIIIILSFYTYYHLYSNLPLMHFYQKHTSDSIYPPTANNFIKHHLVCDDRALTRPGNTRILFCSANNEGLYSDKLRAALSHVLAILQEGKMGNSLFHTWKNTGGINIYSRIWQMVVHSQNLA